MGTFLNADTIKIAVRRLGDSLAQTGIHDFLVLKRASVLSKSPKVILSERNKHFMQAIEELTSCNEPLGAVLDSTWHLPPYINVFGTAKHSKDPAWKKSCRIVWQPEGGWDVLSPGGRFWWNPSSCEWWLVGEKAHQRGMFRDRVEALRVLESYMVTPPEERSES
jgi:hypothetical protein